MSKTTISTPAGGSLADAYVNHDFTGVTLVHLYDGVENHFPYFNASNTYHCFLNNKTLACDVKIESNEKCRFPAVVNAAGMFDGCSGLTSFPRIDGSYKHWKYTQALFKNCTNVSGLMPWNVKPYWCQQMFMNCKSWDGEGINRLSFADTVANENCMSHLCTNVPLSSNNLFALLGRIYDTVPAGQVRKNVNVGCGHAEAHVTKMIAAAPAGIEIVHTGTQEAWDMTFDAEVSAAKALQDPIANQPTLDFSGIGRLDSHFTSSYNGCLISPHWGVFAKHYMPPVGFTAVTRNGERLVVDRRVGGPGDLALVKFKKAASTKPAKVLDCEGLHPWWHRQAGSGRGYIGHVNGCEDGMPVFAYDRFETPRQFRLGYISSEGSASIGPAPGGFPGNGQYTVGDSGSISFLVDSDGDAVAVSEAYTAGGGGTMIGHHRAWVKSVINEPIEWVTSL